MAKRKTAETAQQATETTTTKLHPILEGLQEEPTGTTAEPTENIEELEEETGEEEGVSEPVGEEAGAGTEPEWDATEADFLTRAKELGYEGDDEHEAAVKLLESYQAMQEERELQRRRLSELEELAEYGTKYLRDRRTAEEPAPAAKEEPAKPAAWWNPPQFESKWIEQYRDVTVGEDGQPAIGWKKSTPPEVREAAEHYQAYLEQWATDLVQRPQEVLPKVIEQEFDRLFEDRIQRRDEETRVRTLADQIKDTNKDWMYTTDGQGREVLSEQGQVMTNLLAQVAQDGVTDPAAQWRHAVAMYDYLNRAERPTAAPTETPREVAEEKRRRQLRRGIPEGTGNRSGTVPRPEDDDKKTRAQNPNLTPGRQLLDQLRRDGVEF